MKSFLLITAIIIVTNLSAQIKFKLDADTVVKDSSGTIYPYSIWQRLLQTNQAGIKPINPKDPKTEFIIYLFTEEQKAKSEKLRAQREANAPKPAESKFFRTGTKLASFKEKDIDGNKFSIKDLKGKVVVLNFWFVNCPPCRAEIPQLNKIVDKYADSSNVVFIAVALDEAFAIKEFTQTTPFKYHIIDNGRYIAQSTYGISLYPTHVIIDKEGIVRFHTSGLAPGTLTWINKTIESLLQEEAK